MEVKQIHCICGGIGFPQGTASTKRVMLMGRALYSVGVTFHVWHIGPSTYSENTDKQGERSGVTWEYLSPSICRPKTQGLRILCFLYGCALLPLRLWPLRKKVIVYLYYQGDLINLWVLLICRILNIPVAQECCEWWPGTSSESRLNRWMYKNVMFSWSSCSLPISDLIASRIKNVARKNYPILKIPVLVDAHEVQLQQNQKILTPGAEQPYLFWCGMVDGYKRDPLFLIRVLGLVVKHHNIRPNLVIGGPCSDSARTELVAATVEVGLKPEQLIITDFIKEDELFRLAIHASVLLLPLWDDDRSKSRFPTKLGLYTAAGSPILSSPIGEISNFLEDGKTALLALPGDEVVWANCINRLLQDEILSEQIVARVLADVLPNFEYQGVGPRLKELFSKL